MSQKRSMAFLKPALGNQDDLRPLDVHEFKGVAII